MTTSPKTEDQHLVRRQKLAALREAKRDYPHGVKVKDTAADIATRFGEVKDAEALAAGGSFSVAGRVAFVRSFGKAGFVKVRDRSGVIQLYVGKDNIDAESFKEFEALDLGDIVHAEGTLMRTKTGELSLLAKGFRILSKCLHAPPEKFHGLSDIEERYRKRYVDLMSSDESRKVFMDRAAIVQGVREYFLQRQFMEVETPMMHSLVSGAAARPFVTHHNTLDMKLYLRIAPELHLKRLVVGGFERVFEINRNFRNEGVSTRHNPEFTMIEFYMAYATYHDLMDMTEELISGLAQKVRGSTTITVQGQEINLGSPWTRISMENAVITMSGYEGKVQDTEGMRAYLKQRGAKLTGREQAGHLLTMIFEEDVEKQLIQPTFVTGYPVEVSPLARRADKPSNEGFAITERFELFINGGEIANGFNELNDPDDQRARFESQTKEKDAGNVEATDFDADYIQALEYGLPPTAGEGIGIDRLTMLLTDCASIRDVILFPLMRQE
ncbi:MAG: lysine--tRNA ligase [Bdellovibrionales bacterium]|nr:lysine--tRNA ligase [Bdellovibrionales bacterium]